MEEVSFNVFRGPTIQGVALGDVNGDVWVSLHGLAPGKSHVLIGSTQPCSQSYSAADTLLSYSFGATQTGSYYANGGQRGPLTGAIDDANRSASSAPAREAPSSGRAHAHGRSKCAPGSPRSCCSRT